MRKETIVKIEASEKDNTTLVTVSGGQEFAFTYYFDNLEEWREEIENGFRADVFQPAAYPDWKGSHPQDDWVVLFERKDHESAN